jgi:hypothetical protein
LLTTLGYQTLGFDEFGQIDFLGIDTQNDECRSCYDDWAMPALVTPLSLVAASWRDKCLDPPLTRPVCSQVQLAGSKGDGTGTKSRFRKGTDSTLTDEAAVVYTIGDMSDQDITAQNLEPLEQQEPGTAASGIVPNLKPTPSVSALTGGCRQMVSDAWRRVTTIPSLALCFSKGSHRGLEFSSALSIRTVRHLTWRLRD